MHAAIVDAFDRPPHYGQFADPVPVETEVVIDVAAASLSQLVRLQASGRHYATRTLPFIPGVDGTGRLSDGRSVYFAFPRPPMGAMAERVAVRTDHVVAVPDGVEMITAAAIAN